VHVNVFPLIIEVKLIYTSGKKFFSRYVNKKTITTKAMKKWIEGIETGIKALTKYFSGRVKFLLNWKYGN